MHFQYSLLFLPSGSSGVIRDELLLSFPDLQWDQSTAFFGTSAMSAL